MGSNKYNDDLREYLDANKTKGSAINAKREDFLAGYTQAITERIGDSVPCMSCHGIGVTVYGSTATWRGGIGGSALTADVCDVCWGSGTLDRPWADLRRVAATIRELNELKSRMEGLEK